ncbi:MAG: ribonuclease HI family protein [Deltaproteobacteria bacterium]|nr:ribonuclease HI family protein [Deltaproteobacteria bacterium]
MARAGISKSQTRAILQEATRALRGSGDSQVGGQVGVDVLHLYTDGASRGNPGQAGAGVVIMNGEGEVVKRSGKYLGVTTNNVAEYEALILGLENASEMGGRTIAIFADSELMVKQVKGEYRVKNSGLIPLYRRVCTLLRGFENYDITHIVRSKNGEADELANIAIDKASAQHG